MSFPNPSTALASVIVDELARNGVRFAVAAPGSRSTALVLAIVKHPEIELVMVLDERSGGFQALGVSKATGAPTVVLTTSGTAVANLMPAVVEADASFSPLLVISADRPPEMRSVGANQSIQQSGMFGDFVRASADLGPAEAHPEAPGWWRSTVSQVVGKALGFGAPGGPVQLNVAFREPTVPVGDDGRSRAEPFPFDDEPATRGSHTQTFPARRPRTEDIEALSLMIEPARRGVIVAGGGPAIPHSVAELGDMLGWPVIATAESGLRRLDGCFGTGHHTIGRLEVDFVLRLGTPGPSRRMVDFLAAAPFEAVVAPSWSDPARSADAIFEADPGGVIDGLLESTPRRDDRGWLEWWVVADRTVRAALGSELDRLSEPGVAVAVCGMGADRLTVASSMPIRDIEAFAFDSPPVVANRGASGIDGFVSTALGVARGTTRPLALSGDLSMLHDSNGFISDPLPPAVFVVIDNSGGGIFSFLPQAVHAGSRFERLFATPHRRSFEHLATLHGIAHDEISTLEDLQSSVNAAWERKQTRLIVVRTDSSGNVVEHQRLDRIAGEAVRSIQSD